MSTNADNNNFLCIDFSGSTGGHAGYWDYVTKLIEIHSSHQFICWDTIAHKYSKERVLDMAKKRTGFGGTEPKCIIPYLPTKCNLVLVTDGQINQNEVVYCDRLLDKNEFESVNMHFYSTGGPMDMSVVAPFTRNTTYNVYRDGSLISSGSTKELLDLTEYYDNPQKFIDDAQKLQHRVTFATMGRPNIPLRNSILSLQENLLKFIANNKSKSVEDEFTNLREMLTENRLDCAIELTKNLITKTKGNELAKEVDSIVQPLINQCANPKSFSFDLLQPSRLMRAEIETPAEEELPKERNYDGIFECPILMDIDTPCLLINKGPAVLDGLDNSYLNKLISDPLLLLSDQILKNKLRDRLDHIFGLEAINMLFKDVNVVSPITRKSSSCALSLCLEKSHNKSNKYTLANIFFGSKIVGSLELWMSVIYFTLADIPYLNSNVNFMNDFEQYLVNRFRKNYTRITLSGLTIEPMLRCPYDVAIWFCVNSYRIMNPNSISNRLRDFGNSSFYLMKLLDLLKYPYDRQIIPTLIKKYAVFNWMMRQENDNNNEWRKMIRSIYQNSMVLKDGFIVMLDGPATQNRLPNLLKNSGFSDIELFALSKLVDRTKRRELIHLPDNLSCEIPSYVENYCYPDVLPMHKINISPKTMRPFCYDKSNNLHWKESAEKIFGPIPKIISAYAYFIKYVQEYRSYPTIDSFIKFMSIKQANKEDAKDTLPKDILVFALDVFMNYEEVLGENFSNMCPEDFIGVTEISRNSEIRFFMEESNDPKDIAKFVYH